jgi:hypothetical protein
MRRFDRVSTISQALMALATKKGVAADKLVMFPNWINLDAIQPLKVVSSYRAELGIPADAVVALYSGNMGGKQGLKIMGQDVLCAPSGRRTESAFFLLRQQWRGQGGFADTGLWHAARNVGLRAGDRRVTRCALTRPTKFQRFAGPG